jgi:hypothetical protein
MQPPGSGSGASLAGTTGNAPPPVRPPESGVPDVGALGCAPTAAPHPTIRTNMAAAPRKAIAVLPLFITIPNCRFSTCQVPE